MALPFSAARPHSAVVATPLRDGTAVLLHLDTKRYFSLDVDGWRCWSALAAGTQLPAGPALEAFWSALADHALIESLPQGASASPDLAGLTPQLTAYPSLAGITFLSGGGVMGGGVF